LIQEVKQGGYGMPFIHVYAYSGRDLETKKKAATAIVKTASEAMGAPEAAFTVVFQDVEREAWEKNVKQAVIDPLRDKMLIDHGKPV
jgi:phenylpyruvate tautomerase PptA (4-oxalocrotonate tautomerase family)